MMWRGLGGRYMTKLIGVVELVASEKEGSIILERGLSIM
jgi:hypothetical protein